MVYILLAPGFEEIEAVTTIDILRRAGVEIKIAAVANEKTVTGAHGITLAADLSAEEIDPAQMKMIILPGGVPGTDNLQKSETVLKLLRFAFEQNLYIAAICAAPSILGKCGYLQGKNAVCFPGYEDALLGANVMKLPVVTDGRMITSRGAGTAHLFAFALVELLKGGAEKLKNQMLYE